MRTLLRLAAAVLVAGTPAMFATTTEASTVDSGVLGSVSVGTDSRMSAAIYDEHGQLVRHLYDLLLRPGTVNLTWDGKDDDGNDLPGGRYNWRAITTGVVGSHDGQAGDRGVPVSGKTYVWSENPGGTSAVTYGSDGDLFLASWREEVGNAVRRIAPADLSTGKQKWLAGDGFASNHAIAVDDNYIYVAGSPGPGADYQISRRDAKTGAASDPKDWPPITITSPWQAGQPVVTGLAVDGLYLWVADTAGNQLRVYTKSDGKPALVLARQNSISLTAPHALARDDTGLWVVTGDEVRHYFFDDIEPLFMEDAVITLDHPYGVALDHANNVLYVSEIGTGKIHKYDVSSRPPVELPTPWSFSNMPSAGAVSDTTFGWKFDTESLVPGGDASIAVSPDGRTLSVVDVHNGRTLFYDTTTGAAKPERLEGQTFPAPDVSVGVGRNLMFNFGRHYEIDYGTPDAGLGHPWRLVANWAPTDVNGQYNIDSSVVRKLPDGNEYEYVYLSIRCPNPDQSTCLAQFGGILIYRLNTDGPGRGMKRVALIKKLSPTGGPINAGRAALDQLAITTDTNGNGVLGDQGDTTEPSQLKGYMWGNPSVSVDDAGTIWLANAATYDTAPHVGTGRIPLHGFDAEGNPQYHMADLTVPPQTSYDYDPGSSTLGDFVALPEQASYDLANDRLYTAVLTGEFNQFGNYAGTAVRMVDFKTGQTSTVSGYNRFDGQRTSLRDSINALTTDSSGGYFYTGGISGLTQRITMHTWDGLPVARTTTALPTYDGPGWFDRGQSLTAFTNTDGTHYVYGEDVGYGTLQRYAFTHADTVQRWGSDRTTGNTSGDFTWPGRSTSNNLVAWWRLDDGAHGSRIVPDSSGGNHWGLFDGPRLDPDHLVKWWQQDGGVHNGALAFDATAQPPGAVNLWKDSSNPIADNIADDPANPAVSVATWFNTQNSGVLFSYQSTPSRDAQPASSAPALYVGQDGKLYGGALTAPGCATPQVVSPSPVNDGQWHHATLVATPSGQTLYLDGNPLGSTPCGRVTGGLGFTMLGNGYTTRGGAALPGTPGGYFHYTGSLDDVRVYRTALSAADAGELATSPAPRGPLAHWTFDESTGNVAADTSEHSKDSPVTNPIWQPHCGHIGGALQFDGTSTQVTLPNDLVNMYPATVSVWVKTTVGGPVLGIQRGPFPTTPLGVLQTSLEAIGISTTDGTVHSFAAGFWLGGGKGPDLRDGNWHHIALTSVELPPDNPFKANSTFTSTLYVDGQVVDSAPTPNGFGIWSSARPNAQFGAARHDDGTWTYYTGLLDDARIYNRVLTPNEITALAHP